MVQGMKKPLIYQSPIDIRRPNFIHLLPLTKRFDVKILKINNLNLKSTNPLLSAAGAASTPPTAKGGKFCLIAGGKHPSLHSVEGKRRVSGVGVVFWCRTNLYIRISFEKS